MDIRPDEYGANEGTFNFAIACIAIAFIVYVTSKGELPKYIQFFFYTPPAAAASSATTSPATSSSSGSSG